MDKNNYIKQLEETISKFIEPLKNIPFPVAVKAISGHGVLSFDKNNPKDKKLLGRLTEAMDTAIKNAYEKGISTARPNEVGNHIEPFVKDALNSVGLKAEIPLTTNGKHQSAGYPDIYIEDADRRKIYLECKTYNKKSIKSSFRAFYFQPSKSSKITCSAKKCINQKHYWQKAESNILQRGGELNRMGLLWPNESYIHKAPISKNCRKKVSH
ncbi:MAG: hypothetical protein ABIB61_00345 [Candidatus Shapirobacteria bacterium]